MLALKQQLKAKRVTYRDVAAQLRISEATVKRYFSGKAVTVDVLHRMAEIVGLDLFSLVIVAQDHSAVQHGFNTAQLTALGPPGPLRMMFFLMSSGWTATQIAREFDLNSQIDGYLAKLEALGLIRRLSRRGVKLLVKPALGETACGQTAELAVEAAEEFLRDLNLRDNECDFRFDVVRLSQAAALELRRMAQHFEAEVLELSRRNLDLAPQETQWYRVFVATNPVGRNDLVNWR